MKKLLVLALVLGMASLASAGLALQVTEMDGTPYDGRVLQFSDTLIINVVGVGGDSVASTFALASDPAAGTMDAMNAQGKYGVSGMLGSIEDNFFLNGEGVYGVAGQVGNATVNPPYPNGNFIDGILFHCEGKGDVLLTMYDVTMDWDLAFTDGVDIAPNGVWDEVVIHQTPEPASMLLLGLGGLFLRRRK